MSKWIFLTACVLALLISACSSSAPSTDWCYLFNFNNSDYGFSILRGRGEWRSGYGFVVSETTGDTLPYGLDVQYTHPSTVRPVAIRVYIARDRAVFAPINVKTYSNVFGLTIGPASTTLPAEQQFDYEATIVADQLAEGNVIKIEAGSSQVLVLRGIEIRGNGANPFSETNCSTEAMGLGNIPLPSTEMFGALTDANSQLDSIDGPLTSPQGFALLPDETGTLIFSYAKWLISPGGAEELFGPFATIVSHLSIYLAAQLALALVYSIAFVATYLIRWVVWLFKLILQIISAIAEIVNVVTDFAGGIVGTIFKFLGG